MCYTNDDAVKKYDVKGEDFVKYNLKPSAVDPIKPSTDDEKVEKATLTQALQEMLQKIEEAILNDDDSVDVDELTTEAQSMQDKINDLDTYLKSYKQNLTHARAAREKAKLAATYWKKQNTKKWVEWLTMAATLDKLLLQCDKEEERKKAAEAEAIAAMQDVNEENKEEDADDNASGDVIEIDDDNDDDELYDVSCELPEPAQRKSPKKKGARGCTGKEISYDSFKTQLNGGRFGKKRTLHDEYLQWSDGKVHCLVCGGQWIKKIYALHEHCDSASHQNNLARCQKVDRTLQCTGIDDPQSPVKKKMRSYVEQI